MKLFLAYDQGLEHGPTDFDSTSSDPLNIINIAKEGDVNGVVFHKGIAIKYFKEIKKSKIPLIVKLNGKTSLVKGEPISRQVCSVEKAISLGAKGVGYTIYIGSAFESEMFAEFGKIEEEAHRAGLFIILWIYPRSKSIKNDVSRENLAYSCRVAMELGADFVKVKYGGNIRDLKWAVESSSGVNVLVSGGKKSDEFLDEVEEIKNSGIAGMAVGRNIWQSKNPLKIIKKIKGNKK